MTMANDMHMNKLDETVKNILKNVESNNEVSDWQSMQSILHAAPRVNYFNTKYIFITVGCIVFIALSYFIFGDSKEDAISQEITTVEAEKGTQDEPKKVEVSKPVVVSPKKEESPVVVEVAEEEKMIKEEVKENPKLESIADEKSDGLSEKKEKKSRKEKRKEEREIKSEETKTTNKIGLSTLFNLNMDSIKKQQEKTVVDSVK